VATVPIGAGALAVAVAASLLLWFGWPKPGSTGPGPGSPGAEGPAAPQAQGPLRIRPLRVLHYQTKGKKAIGPRRVGDPLFTPRYGDAVTLEVKLSAPAYCYILAFNFHGSEEVLWPVDEKGSPSARLAPPQAERVHFPLSGRLYLELEKEKEGARSGLQAYAAAASPRPLPPFGQWRKGRSGADWKSLPAGQTVWEADAKGAYAYVLGVGADRAVLRQGPGTPPLAALCQALFGDGVEAVEAVAFPVLPKEGP
jgi:hypothetical protein